MFASRPPLMPVSFPCIYRLDVKSGDCPTPAPRSPGGARSVSDFSTELRQRVVEAQRSLTEAREAGDDYLVQLSLGQIESLARLATENQVSVDGVAESLAPYGLA